MAVYSKEQGLQSILNAALGEYHSRGFNLTATISTTSPDRFMKLYYHDKLVCTFSPSDSTIPRIQNACHIFMESVRVSS